MVLTESPGLFSAPFQIRRRIVDRVYELELETPLRIFRTPDRYNVIFGTRKGNEVAGNLSHEHFFMWDIPGRVERLAYRDLTIREVDTCRPYRYEFEFNELSFSAYSYSDSPDESFFAGRVHGLFRTFKTFEKENWRRFYFEKRVRDYIRNLRTF